jgi:hypothetical protein
MSSKEQAARTVPWQYDLFPCESTTGGVNGLHVLPVSNQSMIMGLQWTRSCVPSLCVIRLCSCLQRLHNYQYSHSPGATVIAPALWPKLRVPQVCTTFAQCCSRCFAIYGGAPATQFTLAVSYDIPFWGRLYF